MLLTKGIRLFVILLLCLPIAFASDNFIDRLQSDTMSNNGLCDDGETPLNSDDCAITTESIFCDNSRCIFTEIWFAKILLIIGIILLFKKEYSVFLVLIGVFFILNFSGMDLDGLIGSSTTSPVEYTEQQIQGNVILLVGSKVMPSHPLWGFIIVLGVVLYFINRLVGWWRW